MCAIRAPPASVGPSMGGNRFAAPVDTDHRADEPTIGVCRSAERRRLRDTHVDLDARLEATASRIDVDEVGVDPTAPGDDVAVGSRPPGGEVDVRMALDRQEQVPDLRD